GALEMHRVGEPGGVQVGTRGGERGSIAVAAEKCQRTILSDPRVRLVAAALPCPRVEPAQLLEAEATVASRRDVARYLGRLDQERPAAAHGIEQGQVRRPADQANHAGSEILP